jgi:hypothetical protein
MGGSWATFIDFIGCGNFMQIHPNPNLTLTALGQVFDRSSTPLQPVFDHPSLSLRPAFDQPLTSL